MLEQRDQQIKSILQGSKPYSQDQRDRLKDLINGVIDFRAMAETALGPHWDTLDTARRDTFVTVFRDVVRGQSMSDLGVYNSKVTIDQISVQDDSAYVRTTTEYEGTRTPVEYVLERQASGEWRSFQNVVRRRGFAPLLKSLERKRKEVRAQNEAGN